MAACLGGLFVPESYRNVDTYGLRQGDDLVLPKR